MLLRKIPLPASKVLRWKGSASCAGIGLLLRCSKEIGSLRLGCSRKRKGSCAAETCDAAQEKNPAMLQKRNLRLVQKHLCRCRNRSLLRIAGKEESLRLPKKSVTCCRKTCCVAAEISCCRKLPALLKNLLLQKNSLH